MKVLVANRGEIACRILRTLQEMAIPGIAVYTEPDREAPQVELATDSVDLGSAENYLSIDALLAAARKTGATAVHPGYGFLSQSAAFARACESAGLVFIGPTAASMEMLGDKRASRETAERLGIPVVPGAQDVDQPAAAEAAAGRIGFPVLLKAAGGGGGKGMRLVLRREDLREAHDAARREAKAAFVDDRLILEKYVSPARHVEVQILGDGKKAVALGERECSLQRRYQKVIEESPSCGLPDAARKGLLESAVKLAEAAGYRSAGTVEFLVGADGSYYFLEVNTRLQVEHPVTELVAGIDLVRLQIEVARGATLPLQGPVRGHAIEARLNAEDPYREFLPQSGPVLMLHWPQLPGLRIDAGVREGQRIPAEYDSLLAKIIAWGPDREQARRRLVSGLRDLVLLGPATNQTFLLQILESDEFRRGETYTTTLESRSWTRPSLPEEVVAAARTWLSGQGPGGSSTEPQRGPWDGLRGFRVGS